MGKDDMKTGSKVLKLQAESWSLTRCLTFVSLLMLIMRLAFTLLYPLSPLDFMKADSEEYVNLAERAVHGNFDFSVNRFIRSPLYPVFLALNMILFKSHWIITSIAFQIALSVGTGVVLCLISYRLFASKSVMIWTGLLYAVYPPTLYYVYATSSETQSLFFSVCSFYFLLKILDEKRIINSIGYGVCFTLSYLSRAEILLFTPMLALVLIYHLRKTPVYLVRSSFAILLVWLLITLPWGLMNRSIHGIYVTSSNGGKYVFYLSNSPLGYADAVEIPPLGTPEHDLLMDQYSAFNPEFDSLIGLPQETKQAAFFQTALHWIRENPQKFLSIKITNVRNFFTPGVVFGHHEPKVAWLMLIVCLPFHLLFFAGIALALRTDGLGPHLWFVAYFVTALGYLTLFLYTARFRAYSVEAYYLIYASLAINFILGKLTRRKENLPRVA